MDKIKLSLTIAQQEELFQGLNEITVAKKLPVKLAYAIGCNARMLQQHLNDFFESIKKMDPKTTLDEITELKFSKDFARELEFYPIDLALIPSDADITPAFFALCHDLFTNQIN